ncbi:ABC transporter ATP-binding protein [Paenibacillus albiflavus]|uniref:ABC transporter ATP-binding protein n=1 Tax=Paenibacillus albiflavus TaxID=2545760 RepID=A0A4R4DY21_9BACL|nr:ABC transporter ATP-binding protein [Paenibacillus albiflavus]TCZ70219.1 ABC transporter ATP-binding protein [Paenibacillus albiflavus]
MGNEMIDMQGVSQKIGKQLIVEPFDYKLEQGQVLALCGGNGAGKSTIIRMLVGISQPTTGTVEVGGVKWKQDRKRYAENIGYMPDDFNFGATLTAWETIRFYAQLKGIKDARALETLELVDLAEVRHKKVAAFSKGMRQRLLFAQALLAKPALLVMDEPTNGLDPYWTATFAQLVLQLKAEGHTIVFSTHQLDVAAEAADEAIFLNHGRILSQGRVSEYRQANGEHGLHQVFTQLIANQ